MFSPEVPADACHWPHACVVVMATAITAAAESARAAHRGNDEQVRANPMYLIWCLSD